MKGLIMKAVLSFNLAIAIKPVVAMWKISVYS